MLGFVYATYVSVINHMLLTYTSHCFVLEVGSLEPLTPAAMKALQAASEAKEKSQETQRVAQAMIDTIRRVQQSTHNAVSQGLTQKIAESVTLMVSVSKKPACQT